MASAHNHTTPFAPRQSVHDQETLPFRPLNHRTSTLGAFFMASKAFIYSRAYTPTEKMLIQAIGLYDWGQGRGGFPSNATLIEACGLKTDGQDKGHKAVRRLLAGLQAKGAIRIEQVPWSKRNPTSRIIYLNQDILDDSVTTPGAQVRGPRALRSGDPPGAQVRGIDTGNSIDQGKHQQPIREDVGVLSASLNQEQENAALDEGVTQPTPVAPCNPDPVAPCNANPHLLPSPIPSEAPAALPLNPLVDEFLRANVPELAEREELESKALTWLRDWGPGQIIEAIKDPIARRSHGKPITTVAGYADAILKSKPKRSPGQSRSMSIASSVPNVPSDDKSRSAKITKKADELRESQRKARWNALTPDERAQIEADYDRHNPPAPGPPNLVRAARLIGCRELMDEMIHVAAD
jgi:hypothetical protein